MNIERFIIDEESVRAFNSGFSDYVVKLPNLTIENFKEKMIDSNNTNLKYSSICRDSENITGIILAGNEGTTTMINAMCVLQEYRGGPTARLLVDETAYIAGKGVLELEVFEGNGRAISFYKKYGFKIKDKIDYFAGNLKDKKYSNEGEIRDISFNDIVASQRFIDEKINWQSRIYNILNQDIKAKGYFSNDTMLGFIVYSANLTVSIKQIYVIKEARKKGIGYMLLSSAVKGKLCSCIFIDNPRGREFFQHLGFSEKMNLYRMEYLL